MAYLDTDEDLYTRVLEKTLRYVSFRPRSVKELTTYIRKVIRFAIKKENTTVETLVLRRLEELGYADDSVFAAWWVDQRSRGNIKGNLLIRRELEAKGLHKNDIESALVRKGVNQQEEEIEKACQILRKKQQLLLKYPPRERFQRCYNVLFRRGFASEVIRISVEKCFGKDYNTESF